MVSGLILALVFAIAPPAESPVASAQQSRGLPTARAGTMCSVAGELARAGRTVLGCRPRAGVLRWTRTVARIAPTVLRTMKSAAAIAIAESSTEQRTALVIDGIIVGVVAGEARVGRGMQALSLDARDPARLGDPAGTNRYVLTDPAARSEKLASSGCIASNCGDEIRNYALLRGTEVLNVIVWNGQPLLGNGTPIVSGITIIERRAGEPLGPGSRLLTATETPLTPQGLSEHRVIIHEDRVIGIISGTSELALPASLHSFVVDDDTEVAPDWILQEDGGFIDPDLRQDTAPVNEEVPGSPPTPALFPPLPTPSPTPAPTPTPVPWRLSAERVSAPLGGAGDYAIIVNGVVQNVIVLDPQSAGGQSWLALAAETSQLPPGAILVKREAGDPAGPGTVVEMR